MTGLQVVNVVNAIAGFKCLDLRELCECITLLQSPSTSTEENLPQKIIQSFQESYQEERSSTLDICDKEASGRVLLGLFMTFVRKFLSYKHPEKTFKIDHEYRIFPDRKFAADEAVTAIVDGLRRVIFVLEYKPKVAPGLIDEEAFHISETLIQAYYLRKMFKHPILHCLSDLNDFHFFLITTDSSREFNLNKYWSKSFNVLDTDQLRYLATFLGDIMPE